MAVGGAERRKLADLLGPAVANNIIAEVDTALLDSEKFTLGTGLDATIYYDGTNLVIDPQEVGSGDVQILNGDVQVLAPIGSPGRLLLSTAEETVVDGDELGRIDFQAPSETGADAILVAAAIYAEADSTFSATDNSCELVFATAASEAAAEKMRLTSTGQLGIGISTPAATLHVDGSLAISNDAEGSTARLTITTAREVVTLTGATTDTTIAIPSGAVLLGASFNVDTAVVDDGGDDTWSAAYITGSTTSLTSGAAAAQNTKVNATIVPEVASDATEIQFTPNAGSFTSGAIEVVAYYYTFTSLANA